jgi:hypothetical protein
MVVGTVLAAAPEVNDGDHERPAQSQAAATSPTARRRRFIDRILLLSEFPP